MEELPYSHLEKGALLIATPDIDSGLFFRGVVLVCEHNATGSFGLCINKPLEIEIPEEVLTLNDMENPRIKIRQGGPVQPNQMMLLHTSPAIPEETLEVCPGVYLGGDLNFLQDSIENEEGPEIFLSFGYAGWTAGQLEREFLDGQWYLSRATKDIIFNTPSEKLWQKLLREMGGKYALLSMIPEDLSVN